MVLGGYEEISGVISLPTLLDRWLHEAGSGKRETGMAYRCDFACRLAPSPSGRGY